MQSLDNLINKLEGTRKKPLVLVGGTYDILHIGHTRYFEKCKQLGNMLIVHIVGDQKVKERKGIFRPINKELDRAEIVSNLKSVDDIFIHNGCTYSDEVIQSIRPDILILSGEKEKKHQDWKKILENRYDFLNVEIVPMQTTQSSSQKYSSERMANLFESFKTIKGFSWDLYHTQEMLNFEFEGTKQEIFESISKEIQTLFLRPEICEDVLIYGSVGYGGVVDSSDIDLIGINRHNKKNRKYFFRFKNNEKIIPVTVRIDNGIDYYHTRFRYRPFPKSPEEHINDNFPKCWGFIPKNVFSKNSIMNQLAQIDAIECLAAVSQVLFYREGKNEIIITPDILAEKVREEFMKTRRRELFTNRRWERGLKENCVKTMESALKYCDFWANEIEKGSYKISKINGLKSRDKVYNSAYVLMNFFSKSFIAYQIDKRRYSKITPCLFS